MRYGGGAAFGFGIARRAVDPPWLRPTFAAPGGIEQSRQSGSELDIYHELCLKPYPSKLRLPCMFPFAEFVDHLLVERRNIVGLAAGNEPIVHHHFLVHPLPPAFFTSV
jgi:hypothetical protein